ncbi:unnamed protein product [Closterium sp. NIES-64]|nr:unnamed protein product [Closterium sp. NIES-64]
MTSPSVLTFDAEGRGVDFEVWVDDLQLFLQGDRVDGLSLFDLTSGASPAPTADGDATLPDSLRVVRDHFLLDCPTTLTVDLLEKALLAAEKSIVAIGASRSDPRTPVFEGCSPSPLLPSVASAAAADLVGFESIGAASAPSGRRRTGKGKGGKGAGGARGGGGAVEAAEAVVVAEGAEAAEVAEEAEVVEEAEVEEAAEAAAAAVAERVATLRKGVAQVVVRASSSGVV